MSREATHFSAHPDTTLEKEVETLEEENWKHLGRLNINLNTRLLIEERWEGHNFGRHLLISQIDTDITSLITSSQHLKTEKKKRKKLYGGDWKRTRLGNDLVLAGGSM